MKPKLGEKYRNRPASPESKVLEEAEAPGSTEKREDLGLLARARGGDGEAFDAIVLRYQDRVYNLLLRLCASASEAEDLTQEAFLKAYRALSKFHGESAFYTWLYRIAVNAHRSRRRSEGRRRQVEQPEAVLETADGEFRREAEAPGASPEEEAVRREAHARVKRELDRIPEEYREVIVLRDVEGLEYDAIAEVVGASRSAVKSRLHRARQSLAAQLKDLMV